jgi:hypothetical protein
VESLLSYQHDLDHIKSHRPLRYETYSYPEEGKQNELFFIEKYCSKEDFLAHKESSPFKKFKSWLAENDVVCVYKSLPSPPCWVFTCGCVFLLLLYFVLLQVVHKIGADMRDEKLGHSTSYAKGY